MEKERKMTSELSEAEKKIFIERIQDPEIREKIITILEAAGLLP